MARLSKRMRARLAVTTMLPDVDGPAVLYTRDVSATGLFLETTSFVPQRYRLEMSVVDADTGGTVELLGEVTRVVEPTQEAGLAGIGVRLISAPADWLQLIRRLEAQAAQSRNSTKFRTLRRFSVLVVGAEERRRAAVALYVQSGWNVRFASAMADVEEALRGFRTDVVIVEHDVVESFRQTVLELAYREQPEARRLVRQKLGGSLSGRLPSADPPYAALIDRAVDADGGLEAILEALDELR